MVKLRFSPENTNFDVLASHSPDVHILKTREQLQTRVIFYSYEIDSRVDKVCVMWSTLCVLGLYGSLLDGTCRIVLTKRLCAFRSALSHGSNILDFILGQRPCVDLQLEHTYYIIGKAVSN